MSLFLDPEDLPTHLCRNPLILLDQGKKDAACALLPLILLSICDTWHQSQTLLRLLQFEPSLTKQHTATTLDVYGLAYQVQNGFQWDIIDQGAHQVQLRFLQH